MQRCVLYCKRTTCSARLPALLGRCSVHASCVHACPHLSRVASVRRVRRERERERERVHAWTSSSTHETREAANGARVSACECVRVRAYRARVLSHGGEQHAAVSRPGVANHHRRYTLPFHRRYRLSRRATLVSCDERILSLLRYVHARMRCTLHARRHYPPPVVAIPSAVNMPRRDPWYWAR